jgi:hypothetical protein
MNLFSVSVHIHLSLQCAFSRYNAFDDSHETANRHLAQVSIQSQYQFAHLFVAVILVVQVVLHYSLDLNVLGSFGGFEVVCLNGVASFRHLQLTELTQVGNESELLDVVLKEVGAIENSNPHL